MADVVDHIDYLVDMIASREWSIEDYPDDSGTYPIGLETQITNIPQELVRQGYSADAMAGILGHNWIDLFKRVWSAKE